MKENIEELNNRLKYSVVMGDIENIKSLLKEGADPQCRDEDGYTLLHRAVINNNPESIRILVSNGADTNDDKNKGKYTALHSACSSSYVEPPKRKKEEGVIETLLKLGANPNAEQPDGSTPMHYAVWNDNLEAFKLLLEYGGNPLRRSKKNKEEIDILEVASQNINEDAINDFKKVIKKHIAKKIKKGIERSITSGGNEIEI